MADNEDNQSLRLVLIAGAGLVVLLGAVLIYWLGVSRHSGTATVLAEEERAYLIQIEVTKLRMSAADNFLGHTVTYLDAQITNKGTRKVSRVQLELEFVDMLGQVVLRETPWPINAQSPALKPGETRDFQVPFEHMPIDWNQAPPRIRVKSVSF